MSQPRSIRYQQALLKRQSDLFHAFEWLRATAMDGNKHAAVLMKQIKRLEKHGLR